MDKYEYKVRAEEIENLIRQREYEQAAEIADTIDWRRVKSVKMLCTVSDLYKVIRRYEDAIDMLLLAYEHRPGGRNICYALCELYLKTGEIVQAMEYYKEFVQVAPKDAGRFILLYKIYEVQEVSLEERIAVLEQLKKYDYREKWAYELAYLYHRVGLEARCVEECDEMILWFGEGSYVIKAMELKMLHQPLSPEQQEKYDHRMDEKPVAQSESENAEAQLSASHQSEDTADQRAEHNNEVTDGDTKIYEPVKSFETTACVELPPEESGHGTEPEELDIQVKTMDMGIYNTINLQAELAEGLKEVLGSDAITRSIVAPMTEDSDEMVFGEMDEDPDEDLMDDDWIAETEPVEAAEESAEVVTEELVSELKPAETEALEEKPAENSDVVMQAEPPKEMAHVLSQESDGQISLVLPESGQVEKQITGQMSIEDIMAEWERIKKENQEKRQEEVRQHVLQQTGNMFTEFEAAVRDGLLEQLESSDEDEADEVEELEELEEPGAVEMIVVEKVLAGKPEMEPECDTEAEINSEPEMNVQAETAGVAEEAAAEKTEAAVKAEAEAENAETAVKAEAEAENAETAVKAEAEAENAEAAVKAEAEAENAETAVKAEAAAERAEAAVKAEAEAENAEAAEEKTGHEEQTEESEKDNVVVAKESDKGGVRPLTEEEANLYAPYIQSENARNQLVKAIDGISLAAYTGNLIITGEEGMDTVTLAKNMIHEAQAADSNLSGKVAKISGHALNKKNVEETLNLLQNGALIIRKAGDMDDKTVQALYKALQKENLGIIIIIEDKKKSMNKLLETHRQLQGVFTERVDVEAMSNDELVAYGKQYAYDNEYSIDDLGVLALHTRIDELQTIDHAVTAPEVQTMVDDAIHHVNRKTIRHFFDILFAKRYDEEDMIVLTERDFA